MKAAPGGGYAFCLVDFSQDRLCQSIAPANNLESHTAQPEPFSLEAQEGAQQPKDALDFGERTTPVIGGERVEGEATDTGVECALDHAPRSGDPGTMTGDAGQAAP